MSPRFSAFLRRRRRLLLGLAVAFVVFSLAGFFLGPVLVRQQLVKHASAALRRPVTVEAVRVNPWALSLTIRGLSVRDHDGSELAGWDEFYANFEASSLFRGTWYFGRIHFVRPRCHVETLRDGSLNIADLLPPPSAAPAAPPPAAPLPSIGIGHLQVDAGHFSYTDDSRAARFENHLGPTSFELRDFTTRPQRFSNYTFAATTESGERFAWQGTVSVDPPGSRGRLGIADVKLAKYAPFLGDFVHFSVAEGRLDVTLDYEVSLAGEPAAKVTQGAVLVRDLQLHGPGAPAPFLRIARLAVDGLAADTARRTATVESLTIDGAQIAAERRADGSVDLADWLQPKMTSAASTGPTPPGPAWAAQLARLQINQAGVKVTDRTTPRPVSLALDDIGVSVTGASLRLDQPVGLDARLTINGTGRLAVAGQVTPQPLAADLKVDLAGLGLRPFDPYLAPFLNVLITSGDVRAAGRVTMQQPAGGTLDLRWEGDAGLGNFAAVDGVLSEPLASVADLALVRMNVALAPLSVAIGEIAVQEPAVRVVVAPDRQVNLLAALHHGAGPDLAATPATAAAPSPRPAVTIGRVVLAGARFSAVDRSVQPEFTAELSEFSGTIAGLSSEQLARADVDLAGRLGLAPLRITGQINPLGGDAFTDLTVKFTGIELPPFTPYSGRYLGSTISKGKVSLDLAYKLSARSLAAENKVVLDQFYLGDKVASPEATGLPVGLALALLRDRDGRITVDLPIRGNLDDPDFKYGKLVWQTLGNIVAKAATAPFALLGGLFGGGRDLSFVEFAPGGAELGEGARGVLDGLARSLYERPGISLEIDSRPAPGLDESAVREARLLARLKARKLQELAATTATAIDPAALTVSPEETTKYLAEFYAALPAPVAPAAALAPAPAAAPVSAAEPRSRGVLGTVRRWIGLGPKPAAPPPPAPAAPLAAGEMAVTGADGQPQVLPVAEVRARVLAAIEVTEADFRELAARRATAIQQYLLETGKADAARVFLATATDRLPAPGALPRVEFSLK